MHHIARVLAVKRGGSEETKAMVRGGMYVQHGRVPLRTDNPAPVLIDNPLRTIKRSTQSSFVPHTMNPFHWKYSTPRDLSSDRDVCVHRLDREQYDWS